MISIKVNQIYQLFFKYPGKIDLLPSHFHPNRFIAQALLNSLFIIA